MSVPEQRDHQRMSPGKSTANAKSPRRLFTMSSCEVLFKHSHSGLRDSVPLGLYPHSHCVVGHMTNCSISSNSFLLHSPCRFQEGILGRGGLKDIVGKIESGAVV